MDHRTAYKQQRRRFWIVTSVWGIPALVVLPFAIVIGKSAKEPLDLLQQGEAWLATLPLSLQAPLKVTLIVGSILTLTTALVVLCRLGRLLVCGPGFRLTCTDCKRFIDARSKWTCGACDHINGGQDLFGLLFGGNFTSFLRHCPKCREEPSAVRCPSCKKAVFLDSRRSEDTIATPFSFLGSAAELAGEALKGAASLAKEAEPLVVEIFGRGFEHGWKMNELQFAKELEEALAAVYESKLRRVKTEQEIKGLRTLKGTSDSNRDELRQTIHKEFASDEAVADVRREYAKKFKADAHMMKKFDLVSARWRESKIP